MFTSLAFGLCAMLFQHDAMEFVAIGQIKADKCDPFFFGVPTRDTISLNGHAVEIDKWDNGMSIIVDGQRFFVPRQTDL